MCVPALLFKFQHNLPNFYGVDLLCPNMDDDGMEETSKRNKEERGVSFHSYAPIISTNTILKKISPFKKDHHHFFAMFAFLLAVIEHSSLKCSGAVCDWLLPTSPSYSLLFCGISV